MPPQPHPPPTLTSTGAMLRLRNHPVYNSPVPDMWKLRSLGLRLACLSLLVAGLPPLSIAADWALPEHQLAQKIVAAFGPGAIYLEVTNRSSLGAKQAEEITRGL